MALTLNFTIEQSADCGLLTVTETTGDGAGGYSDGGNVAFSGIKNSQMVATLPDGTIINIHKNYLPTQDVSPNGSFDITPEDILYTAIPSGVWNLMLEHYGADVASGNIVEGTKYMVTGGTVTYDGTTYAANSTFIGTTETTYVEDTSAEVNGLEASKDCNILIYCSVQSCLKKLMLQRCEAPCDCRDDFHAAMNELIIDFNAAQLAFNEQNYKCASDTLERLEKHCGGICNDCGC